MVREGGLEPPRLVKGHKVLSLARLPVPPLSRAGGRERSLRAPPLGRARKSGEDSSSPLPGQFFERYWQIVWVTVASDGALTVGDSVSRVSVTSALESA